MNRWKVSSLALATLFSVAGIWAVGPGVAHAANTIHVSNTGTDTITCGAVATPCLTIKYAVETRAVSGDTISVAAGTYTGNVNVTKSLVIQGANAGVDARSSRSTETIVSSPSTYAFSISADNVTLDGFTLRDTSGGTNDESVLTSRLFSGYTIVNNIFTKNAIGLYLNSANATPSLVQHNAFTTNDGTGASGGNALYSDQGLANATIDANSFTGSTNESILIVSSTGALGGGGPVTNITVSNNTLTNDLSIALAGATSSLITGNTVTGDQASAIYLEADNGVTVTKNTLSGGQTRGVNINTNFASGVASQNIAITNNQLVNNTLYGVYVGAASYTGTLNIHDNRLVGNGTAGLTVSDATGVDATFNWWGCNTGPNTTGCDKVTGTGVSFNNWLILKVYASNNNGVSNAVADLRCTNINGVIPCNTGHQVPDGTPVHFFFSSGSPNAFFCSGPGGTNYGATHDTTTTGGVATVVVCGTSGPNPPVNVCAKVDNQTQCANVTPTPPLSNSPPNSASASYQFNGYYVSTLIYQHVGEPLQGFLKYVDPQKNFSIPDCSSANTSCKLTITSFTCTTGPSTAHVQGSFKNGNQTRYFQMDFKDVDSGTLSESWTYHDNHGYSKTLSARTEISCP